MQPPANTTTFSKFTEDSILRQDITYTVIPVSTIQGALNDAIAAKQNRDTQYQSDKAETLAIYNNKNAELDDQYNQDLATLSKTITDDQANLDNANQLITSP